MVKVALITFTVGDETQHYERLFLPAMRAYAEKWGFTFIQIKEYLVTNLKDIPESEMTKNKMMIQKLAIPLQPWIKDYDYCVYVDADILINYHTAPNILDGIPYGKIAAVNERSYFGHPDNVTTAWKRVYGHEPNFAFTVDKYYEQYNFGKSFQGQINAGLMVFQPSIHTPFFQMVFDTYAPRLLAGENLDGDQGPLNFEGHSRDLFFYLDERWNRIWGIVYNIFYPFLTNNNDRRNALANIFSLSYAIHFTARFGWDLLEQSL
jgi:hypothetical protein